MGQNSQIEWTTHTFNPWRGCTKVSDGCKHCYADTLSHRNPKTLGVWGPTGTRVVAADSAWKEPLKWNRLARVAGERHRVFCASLADVAEGRDTMPPQAWDEVEKARKRLGYIIDATPELDWLLLTKRPENYPALMETMFPGSAGPRRNVWLGTSVENQQTADERIHHLLRCPAAVRFLSCEPLLGALRLAGMKMHAFECLKCHHRFCEGDVIYDSAYDSSPECPKCCSHDIDSIEYPSGAKIDWVIVGCESIGKKVGRFFDGYVDAARAIIAQCRNAGVPVFHKQIPVAGRVSGDPAEWADDLRVREFPRRNVEKGAAS